MKIVNLSRVGSAAETDYEGINERALQYIDDVLTHLDLEGDYQGKEYVALNPHRNDGEAGSFKINTETGAWADFATGDSGGDLISYWRFVKGLEFQSEAAKELTTFIDSLEAPSPQTAPAPRATNKAPPPLRTVPKEKPKGKTNAEVWTAIMPVPDEAPKAPESRHDLGIPSLMWQYRNPEGQLLGHIYRFDKGDNKDYRPLTFCRNAETQQQQWRWQGFPEPRPLYGLELLATRPEAELVICEGEKSADAARLLLPACVVVTTMNGAKSPGKTDLTPLTGRTVTLWPDYDVAGEEYAQLITKLLRNMDSEIPIRAIKPLMLSPEFDSAGNPMLEPRQDLTQGWDAADAAKEGWTPAHLDLIWANRACFIEVPFEERVGEYVITKRGVFKEIVKDGKVLRQPICSYLKVLAQTRDNNNQNWGLLLELSDADGNLHQWAMPRQMLAAQGHPFVQTLISLGLNIEVGDRFRDAVAQYLNKAEVSTRALCVSQLGWHEQVFVTADGMIGPSEERVVVQNAQPDSAKAFCCRGTHAEWMDNVAHYCEGNTRLIFSVCAALTSPCLYWLGEENGGFHLRGSSSIGKTVALNVAVSVWGSPSFLQRWRATANGLEAIAAKFNDTLLALDEMSQVEPVTAGEVAYMLGNGQGKARAGTSGQARQVYYWRLIFLSTGEVSLSDHVKSSGKRAMAGQEVRLVNIPADAGAGLGLFNTIHNIESASQFADRVRGNCAAYFGTAGMLWVTHLADLNRRSVALQQIKSVKTAFVNNFVPNGSAGQVYRVAGRFGIVAGVGEACINAGILPWPAGSAIEAARECYLSWIEHRGGTENFEAETAVNQVRQFFENHGESRFSQWDEVASNDGLDSTSRTVNRAGFRRVMDDRSIRFFVLPEVFRKEICQGLDSKEVAKVLVERGYLVVGRDGKPQSVQRLPGVATPTRVYLISSAILSENVNTATIMPVTQAA